MTTPLSHIGGDAGEPADTAVLHRYLDGAMDETELEAFEIALLDNPALIETVEAEERLRTLLQDADLEVDETDGLAAAGAPSGTNWFGQRLSQAAMLALGVLGYLAFAPDPTADGTGGRITAVSELELQTYRGAEPEFRTQQADMVLLRLFPVFPEEQAYDIELLTTDGELVEAVTDVAINDEAISLVVPGLAVNHYELRLLTRDASGQQSVEQSYVFAVDPKTR